MNFRLNFEYLHFSHWQNYGKRHYKENTVNEYLTECAKKIEAPTLLIWGTLDTAAPIEDAKRLEGLLIDGALIELPGCTHYAYLEALPQVINILNNFL